MSQTRQVHSPRGLCLGAALLNLCKHIVLGGIDVASINTQKVVVKAVVKAVKQRCEVILCSSATEDL